VAGAVPHRAARTAARAFARSGAGGGRRADMVGSSRRMPSSLRVAGAPLPAAGAGAGAAQAVPMERLEQDRRQLPWGCLRGVYCVNLDRRPERWAFMQSQFARLRLPVRRWSAVDGQDVDIHMLADGGLVNPKALSRYFLPDEMKLFGVDLTAGGVGCALSHMQIWKDVVENFPDEGKSWFLIVEDDCQFTSDFDEDCLSARIAQVPDDWEMVFLGGADLMRRQAALEVAPGVRRLYRGFRETTAYLISVAGCKACLEVSVPMSWQIDTHLTENEVELEGGLSYTVKPRGYCLFPPLVEQERDRFKTDVQKQEHD